MCPGERNILGVPPIKTTEFEVKNRSKSRIFTVVTLFFSKVIKPFSARNELDEIVIVGESNNAGVWESNFWRDSGAEPQTLRQLFYFFFPKNTHF